MYMYMYHLMKDYHNYNILGNKCVESGIKSITLIGFLELLFGLSYY